VLLLLVLLLLLLLLPLLLLLLLVLLPCLGRCRSKSPPSTSGVTTPVERISLRHGNRGRSTFINWGGRRRTRGGTEAFKGVHLPGEAVFDLVQGVFVVVIMLVVGWWR